MLYNLYVLYIRTSSAANGSNNVAVSGTGGGNSNNNGGTGRTYCRCCYCELFGHSGVCNVYVYNHACYIVLV